MSNKKKQPEILAPAGNETALKAAVYNGADAVYLGIGQFNARAKADNFDLNSLQQALDFAHLFGVKVYVTFNTILKNDEIEKAVSLIEKASAMGVDAFILQDLGLLYALQRRGLKLELHASTQMGVCNLEGAKAVEALGFRRVVLARETLAKDIIKIKQNTNIELEYFVHGALCVAYSGNCYFSSLITGESGNRGRCLQFCRKQYELVNEHEAKKSQQKSCILSPKDLNFINHLQQLKDLGIDSFKIEGRARRPEYVGEVTRICRQALHGCNQGTKQDLNNLKIMFNRGNYCGEGYLHNSTPDVIYDKHPAHIGLPIGKIRALKPFMQITYDKHISGNLHKGDGIKFLRDGVEVGSALIDNPEKITALGSLKVGDMVCLTSSAQLNQEVLSRKKAVSLTAELQLKVGERARFAITDGIDAITTYSAQSVQESKNSPLCKENLHFLSKSGDENILISDITLKIDKNCFLPVSALKQMRNQAIKDWREQRVAIHRKKSRIAIDADNLNFNTQNIEQFLAEKQLLAITQKTIMTMLRHPSQLPPEILQKSDYCILNPSEYSLESIKQFAAIAKEKAVLNLPIIMRGKDIDIIKDIIESSGVDIYIANNLSALELCKEKQIILGAGLNILNDSLVQLSKPITYIASIESQKPQSKAINYIYGQPPLMTLSYCVTHNIHNSTHNLYLQDEKGEKFPLVQKKAAYCYYELLLNIPLDNREIYHSTNHSVLIDLSFESNPAQKLIEILSHSHSAAPHMHGNYKKKLN